MPLILVSCDTMHDRNVLTIFLKFVIKLCIVFIPMTFLKQKNNLKAFLEYFTHLKNLRYD